MSSKEIAPANVQDTSTFDICSQCRKQITPEARRGTFTAYLFAANRCQCRMPISTLPPGLEVVPEGGGGANEAVRKTGPVNVPELGDRYEVIDLIGQGGMGSVWKVRDKSINKTLAVKVLRPELAADRMAVKRFEQEVQAAAFLTQANLVAVYGSGKTSTECPYLVMDYLDGQNLSEVLEAEVFLAPNRVLDLTSQICEALVHAHAKGIVHRDLKPSNIILIKGEGGNDFVKIVDFGIAKIMPSVREQTTELTQTGDLFGSPLYMSPEQCQGEVIDARSDIYSLGCIMYELLSGKQAFAAENPIKVILKQLTEKPPELSANTFPDGLVTIVNRCLEKNPDMRYWSGQELLEDVQSILNGGLPLRREEEKTKLRLLTVDSSFRRFGARAVDGMVVGAVAAAVSYAAFYGMTGWPDRTFKSDGSMHEMLWTVPMIFFGLGVIEEFFPVCLPVLLVLMRKLLLVAGAELDALALSRTVISNCLLEICFFLPLVFVWLYHAGFESSARQATLGKQLFGLKVTDIRGQSLPFLRASWRHFSKLFTVLGLSDCFLFPVYLIKASRSGLSGPTIADFFFRRPLHDRLSRAYVSEDPERSALIQRPLAAAFIAASVSTMVCFVAFITAILAMGPRSLPSFHTPDILSRFVELDALVFVAVFAFKKARKK